MRGDQADSAGPDRWASATPKTTTATEAMTDDFSEDDSFGLGMLGSSVMAVGTPATSFARLEERKHTDEVNNGSATRYFRSRHYCYVA